LNELKEKKEWTWTEEYQWTFKELNEKITSQPILSLLKRKDKFRVEINLGRCNQQKGTMRYTTRNYWLLWKL